MEKSADKVSVWCIVSLASIPLVMTLGNSMLIPVLPILEDKVGITSIPIQYDHYKLFSCSYFSYTGSRLFIGSIWEEKW